MTDFAPFPWPLEIRNRFVFGPVPSEVPGFLHPLISKWSIVLSVSAPDFRYKDIYVTADRKVVVKLDCVDVHDGELQDKLLSMMNELALAYSLKGVVSHDKLRTRTLAR